MKKWTFSALCGVLLALVLATGAQALVLCEVCRPTTQGLCINDTCPYVPLTTTCQNYLANCPGFFVISAKEAFLLSLEEQAMEPVVAAVEVQP
jgi:hypothetical protein